MLQQNLPFQLFGLSCPVISITLKKSILGTHNCIIRTFWERKSLTKLVRDIRNVKMFTSENEELLQKHNVYYLFLKTCTVDDFAEIYEKI